MSEIWVINPLENGSLEDGEREVTFRETSEWDMQGIGSYCCRWILTTDPEYEKLLRCPEYSAFPQQYL